MESPIALTPRQDVTKISIETRVARLALFEKGVPCWRIHKKKRLSTNHVDPSHATFIGQTKTRLVRPSVAPELHGVKLIVAVCRDCARQMLRE